MQLRNRVLKFAPVVGALALAGGLALSAGSGVQAQTGTATPASNVGGPAAVPLARFFGRVTAAGVAVPQGATIAALIGAASCGSATTTQAGQYTIDVQATAGCTPGSSITFTVNGTPANEKGTAPAVSAAVQLDLTVSQATPTPSPAPATATPTRAPTPPPPPVAPTARATTAPTAQPTPVRTAVVPTAGPRTGLGGASQQKPAAPVAQKPGAVTLAPISVQLPNTGAGGSQSDNPLAGLLALGGGLVLLAVSGLIAARRRA